mmetsp:Transcript_17895/g.55028  ORF Transcript_17895/g.55028 Transcript_17895/m.55028 type:complete len:165 (+) Transcript_17895:174-668(+)
MLRPLMFNMCQGMSPFPLDAEKIARVDNETRKAILRHIAEDEDTSAALQSSIAAYFAAHPEPEQRMTVTPQVAEVMFPDGNIPDHIDIVPLEEILSRGRQQAEDAPVGEPAADEPAAGDAPATGDAPASVAELMQQPAALRLRAALAAAVIRAGPPESDDEEFD